MNICLQVRARRDDLPFLVKLWNASLKQLNPKVAGAAREVRGHLKGKGPKGSLTISVALMGMAKKTIVKCPSVSNDLIHTVRCISDMKFHDFQEENDF